MSDTKFTKGEWYAHPNGVGCGGIAIVNTPDGCVIPKVEDIANRDLIAAAPEMYGLLDSIVDGALDESDNREVRALLAKARGEL